MMGMGSCCALAPDPQSGRDEVPEVQPDRQGAPQLITHKSQPPTSLSRLPAAPSTLCLPCFCSKKRGWAPCASARGPKGHGACPSLPPGRLLLPLEGILSCDWDVSFFRKPSFEPPLHPCLALTPGATVSGSALSDRPGPELPSAGGPSPCTGRPRRPAQPCPMFSSPWQRGGNRNSAKVTQLLGGGTGIETQKSSVKAVISALQEEWAPEKWRAGAVEPLQNFPTPGLSDSNNIHSS